MWQEGFEVIALGEDRTRVEKSHARGDRRREQDEMLHLQLLDLALLSQADVLAGVFGAHAGVAHPSHPCPHAAWHHPCPHATCTRACTPDTHMHIYIYLSLCHDDAMRLIRVTPGSTFVKTALQLGRASTYTSLDTFPWCPLLRCFWGWRGSHAGAQILGELRWCKYTYTHMRERAFVHDASRACSSRCSFACSDSPTAQSSTVGRHVPQL